MFFTTQTSFLTSHLIYKTNKPHQEKNFIACLPRITFPSFATSEGREHFHNNATFYMSIHFVDSHNFSIHSYATTRLGGLYRLRARKEGNEWKFYLACDWVWCARNGKMINFHPSNFQVVFSRMITHSLVKVCVCVNLLEIDLLIQWDGFEVMDMKCKFLPFSQRSDLGPWLCHSWKPQVEI